MFAEISIRLGTQRTSRGRWAAFALGCALLAACSGGSGGAAQAKTPEDVVRSYLVALQKGDYGTAYDLLMPFMVRDLGKAAWVTEQTAIMKLADVQISSFQVFPAKLEGDKAIVPNLLKSKDKYINQTGANEYELYTLVHGPEGGWKIQQQQLVESDAVANWFPPSVRETR